MSSRATRLERKNSASALTPRTTNGRVQARRPRGSRRASSRRRGTSSAAPAVKHRVRAGPQRLVDGKPEPPQLGRARRRATPAASRPRAVRIPGAAAPEPVSGQHAERAWWRSPAACSAGPRDRRRARRARCAGRARPDRGRPRGCPPGRGARPEARAPGRASSPPSSRAAARRPARPGPASPSDRKSSEATSSRRRCAAARRGCGCVARSKAGTACRSRPSAKMIALGAGSWQRRRRGLPAPTRRPSASGIATPTMNRKNGKIRSVGVQPCHSAWRSGG